MRWLLFAVFAATLLSMQTPKSQTAAPRSFDLQGHRGCRGLMPENTVPAFLKALELGVNTLELDVVISKDRQVVVSHEPYFNAEFTVKPDGQPVTKAEQKSLNLYQMPYAEIRRYDVGRNGNPAYPEQQKLATYKPLLSEVIREAEAWAKAHGNLQFAYNIEIKSESSEYGKSQPDPAEFSDLVVAQLRSLPPERIVVQSFDFAVLQHWHQQIQAGRYPAVRLAALVGNLRGVKRNLAALGFKPAVYSPYYKLIGKDTVARLHEQGINVVPWTVNETAEMKRLLALGVDGIITDYPNRALGL